MSMSENSSVNKRSRTEAEVAGLLALAQQPVTAVPASFRGRPAIVLQNDDLMVTILTGGGHIASMVSAYAPTLNPLWEPPWPTLDPSMRRLAVQGNIAAEGDKEGELLAGIGGINLCLDVFGQHSPGEVESGLSFHGEAGLVTWEVDSWKDGTLTLTAELTRTMLRCTRSFRLEGPELHVTEKVTSLASFERVLGRCQHVTFGDQFLTGAECQFEALCDKGMTWPTDMDPSGALNSQWQPGTAFDYPNIPRRPRAGGASTDSWTTFPRPGVAKSSDLATMRVDPDSISGWFTVNRKAEWPSEKAPAGGGGAPAMVFSCMWEREAFPWLMTWEENQARSHKPWGSKTVCRGLEISSYAFATSRRDNVERGKLFDTPCFEWLDANETKSTEYAYVYAPASYKPRL